ncbi:Ig-like domain-containing protein [Mobilitalea sibirica]|uniref:Ig-like domain-containing protein n=1 Tax=Mobilitalea sibirica TaxID=1462919 RepID=A0A8J7KZ66_9FIRM|nr:sugar-binding protein [Mobilitalea sibirica]MBH1939498.1 Ig-like domain-containing protein [Mobilitalea sibirica]
MRRVTSFNLKRMLACLLTVVIILPSGIMSQQKVYAHTTNDSTTPVLSKTNYRYMNVGDTYDFNIKNKKSGSSYEWKSSNTQIATVNKIGVVKAKKTGTANITCDITTPKGKYQLGAVVYVRKASKNPAKEVQIINKIDTMIVGETYNLNKAYEPSKSSDYINWTSDNTNVATVNHRGFVKGIRPGNVKITATTLSGEIADSVTITVTSAVTVNNQTSLEKALLTDALAIKIATEDEMEFHIPEGDYRDKKLIVDAPNSSVNNYGLFNDIQVNAIKSDTWHEYAKGNSITIDTDASRIVIEESASVSIHITKSNAKTILEVRGDLNLYVNAAGNIELRGESGKVPNVTISHKGSVIKTNLALLINATQKFTLDLNSVEASKTILNTTSDELIPILQGTGYIRIEIDGNSEILVANSPETGGYAPSPSTPSTPTPSTPEPTVIPEQVTATFGSPFVDGIIDEVWEKAEVIVPEVYGAQADVTAEHRLMWDDNGLYILSAIKDSNLDKSNTASYQQDSLELFLDELYDKAGSYQSDDLHYRVNFDNMRTHDNGEKTRFYTKTQITKDEAGVNNGYIIEAVIIWADTTVPVNKMEMGFDLQINEAKNGNRATTITIFDTTGNAYQNPSLLGKMVLEGKAEGAQTGTNPYALLTYIDSVKEMYLDAYVNKDSITEPLANAESVAADKTSIQAEINQAYQALKAAVDGLNDGSGFTKPSALPLNSILPDAFTFRDGSKVTTLEEWEQRQAEISDMYQYYMYGVVPDMSGESVMYEYLNSYTRWVFDWETWTVRQETVEPAPNEKFIRITVAKGDKAVNFMATATFPRDVFVDPVSGENIITKKPATQDGGYPVLIVIGSLGGTEKQYLIDNGYAVIEYDNNAIAADNGNHTGAFYELYPYGQRWDEQTGVLLAWTWGVSKIIDVLEDDMALSGELNISPVNTMVTGISRNGKSAAVAGAFEPRIKITVPGCSGAGGMASFRYMSAGKQYDYSSIELKELIDEQGAEQGTATWQKFQDEPLFTPGANEQLSNLQGGGEAHWFNDNFLEFSSPHQLPFDQHFLAALTADEDRYFLITGELTGGDWTNPAAMYVSYLAAQNIYDSLGLGDNIGIHLHAVGHKFTLEDTRYLVEFANKKFYGLIDDRMDLSQLKTSIFEDPDTYDTFFDTVKAMKGPVLTGGLLYSDTFDKGLADYIIAVSGAAISVPTLGGDPALRVDKSSEDGYIVIPLVNSGSETLITIPTVSGSAITIPSVSGSAITAPTVSGSAITIEVSMLYNAEANLPVFYEMGVIEGTGMDATSVVLDIKAESGIGKNRYKWVTLKTTYYLSGKDTYLYLKGFNVSSFYIDNIRIK